MLAPPSSVAGSLYSFAQPGWEALSDIPALHECDIGRLIADLGRERTPSKLFTSQYPERGHRNDWLFRTALQAARAYESLEDLLDCVATQNDCLDAPLPHQEVFRIARSAWGYEQSGRNWRGREAVIQLPSSVRVLISQHKYGAEVLALYMLLLDKHAGRRGEFCVSVRSMVAAGSIPGFTETRLRRAREVLIELGLLERTHRGCAFKGDAARFRLCG